MAISGITTCLWFDGQAAAAADFYVETFPGGEITGRDLLPPGAPGQSGDVLAVRFTLFGQSFFALNGGPQYIHSPAISFQVFCDDQAEIDRLWTALTDNGGEESRCGWCVDRFGVSWQVIPRDLPALLTHPDPDVSAKAVANMLLMNKIVIADLQ